MLVDLTHLPDLAALELLVEVADQRSIGAAARAVGISQQSASERIRTAEQLVGAALLLRGPRGSELTPAGAVVVEWARRLLDLADQTATAIGSLRADRDRSLQVAASMTVAEHLFPRWLVTLRTRDPVTVRLIAANSTGVVEQVRTGGATLGFIEGVRRPTGLRSTVLGGEDLVLVAHPAHRWSRRRRRVSVEELATTPLTSREPGSGTREVLEAALAHHGRSLALIESEATTSTAVRESIRVGAAPGILSRHAVGDDLATGRLVEIATDLDLHRDLLAIWAGGPQPPAGPARDIVAIARHQLSAR